MPVVTRSQRNANVSSNKQQRKETKQCKSGKIEVNKPDVKSVHEKSFNEYAEFVKKRSVQIANLNAETFRLTAETIRLDKSENKFTRDAFAQSKKMKKDRHNVFVEKLRLVSEIYFMTYSSFDMIVDFYRLCQTKNDLIRFMDILYKNIRDLREQIYADHFEPENEHDFWAVKAALSSMNDVDKKMCLFYIPKNEDNHNDDRFNITAWKHTMK